MSELSDQARRLVESPNRISVRLSDGWYPSRPDAERGHVHDRHVLIWVRNYETLILNMANEIERLEASS